MLKMGFVGALRKNGIAKTCKAAVAKAYDVVRDPANRKGFRAVGAMLCLGTAVAATIMGVQAADVVSNAVFPEGTILGGIGLVESAAILATSLHYARKCLSFDIV